MDGATGRFGLLIGLKSQPSSQLLMFLLGIPSLSKTTKQSIGTAMKKEDRSH